MVSLRGSIFKGDELVFADIEVQISISTDVRTQLKAWHGTFLVPDSDYIAPGVQCRLVLEDGREGVFYVDNMIISSRDRSRVYFKGSGPLE